jgi:glycosyltransferase involved in cell wall biosynthesis
MSIASIEPSVIERQQPTTGTVKSGLASPHPAELSIYEDLGKYTNADIAVLIPCYNEAISIASVIAGFNAVLPSAKIYVYDNRSTDDTMAVARNAGAIVRSEPWPGKGNVVRRMFADIDADVYIMADGDGTYDPAVAPSMISRLLNDHLDMVVGTRKDIYENAHRSGHAFGNKLFNGIYRRLFGPLFTDIFSGYRVFSRRFVKSFPAISSGFEIETEMSVHASEIRMPICEVPTNYGARQEGSVSKLRTFHDAFRILRTIARLFKEIQPAKFYGVIAAGLMVIALMLGYPLFETYMRTGLVPRIPTAILVTGIVLLAGVAFGSGLVLDSVARGRLEMKLMMYLGYSSAQTKPTSDS